MVVGGGGGGGGNADSVGITTTPPSTQELATTLLSSIPLLLVPTSLGIRDSSTMGSGDDYVIMPPPPNTAPLRPCLGSENSSIDLGSGNDRLFINASLWPGRSEHSVLIPPLMPALATMSSPSMLLPQQRWGWGNAQRQLVLDHEQH